MLLGLQILQGLQHHINIKLCNLYVGGESGSVGGPRVPSSPLSAPPCQPCRVRVRVRVRVPGALASMSSTVQLCLEWRPEALASIRDIVLDAAIQGFQWRWSLCSPAAPFPWRQGAVHPG
jgi:hypothetical protein